MTTELRLLRSMFVALALVMFAPGCETLPPDDGGNGDGNGGPPPGPVYNNTTDRSNKDATFIGAGACRACHPEIAETHTIHGHAHKLTRVQGEPPEFPPEGTRAGVPTPPEGIDWSQVSYVIGGYTKKARFIDLDGYIYITGISGIPVQWNLSYPANGANPGFANYESARETPKPYDFSCFVCHVTGPEPLDEDFPVFQENRPGFAGTWQEEGVQCEACHGPGSNHVPNPPARDIFVNTSAAFCGECHNRPFNAVGGAIMAAGGFIQHHEQYPELLASGAHAALSCATCHDVHTSVTYDRENAMRRECADCHEDQTMALHSGITYVRGDYVESLGCESCHMTYATRSATAASESVVGPVGRMGDVRTHIFRIDTRPVTYLDMFNSDLSEVQRDEQGRAAVTVDYVCLRCHNGMGNAFDLTISAAAAIAADMHSAGQ